MDFWAFGARDSEIVVASRHYGDNPVGGTTLSLLSQNKDGSVSAKHAWTSSAEFYRNPEPPALLPGLSRRIRGRNRKHHGFFLRINLAPDISLLGRNRRFRKTPSPRICVPKNTRTRCFTSTCSACCCRPPNHRMAMRWCFRTYFKMRSRPQARSCLSPSATMRRNAPKCSCPWTTRRTAVSIGRNGCVAVRSSISIGTAQGTQGLAKTVFYDSETLEAKQSLIAATTAIGSWTSDGKLRIDIGRSITNTMNGAGSPLGNESNPIEGPLIHYVLHRTDRYTENRFRNPPRPLDTSKRR